MNSLVVFYSRTGNTKKVAVKVSEIFKADVEELIDKKNRNGLIGLFLCLRDVTLKKLTKINSIKKDPNKYDLIIIGTPVWAGNMSPAVRTYLSEQKKKLKNVAFFCTMGGSGDERCFNNMEELIGKKPFAKLTLKSDEVKENKFVDKIKEFVKNIS